MKRSIERKILLCAIALVLGALPATAQEKKSEVKVNYDKLKDRTCASIYIGHISDSLTSHTVSMYASYCSQGQKLEAPTMIDLRLYSGAWLEVVNEQWRASFLLDGNERLTFVGRSVGVPGTNVGSMSVEVPRGDLLRITSAKLVEFQLGAAVYKLQEKELGKLKDLAESRSADH